jgi:coniferyl-aldehyde dehydrogenase
VSTLNGVVSHNFDLDLEAVHGADAQALLDRQRAAFLKETRPDHDQRTARLARLRAAVLAYRTEVEEAISADFGHRSRHETGIMELVGVIQAIDYLTRNLRRFMRPERRHVGLVYRPGRAYVE